MSAGMAELRNMSADELCEAELKAPAKNAHPKGHGRASACCRTATVK